MKTAISLPDETFNRAERAAKEMGLTRSELYTRAVESYVERAERSTLTDQLNAAIDRSGTDEDATADVVASGRRLVSADGDEW